ncbi:MAG: hypothetical protein P4L98_23630 [Ancalomicrobiaceae bacterium]|nr:hypothetical protein [Ancalomicrobiaceae bacterium]
MSAESQIQQITAELAKRAQLRVSSLRREVAELEKALEEKKAALATAELGPARLERFQVKQGVDLMCPYCWMGHERHAILKPIGGGTRHEDFFRCSTCQQDVTVAI